MSPQGIVLLALGYGALCAIAIFFILIIQANRKIPKDGDPNCPNSGKRPSYDDTLLGASFGWQQCNEDGDDLIVYCRICHWQRIIFTGRRGSSISCRAGVYDEFIPPHP